MVAIVNHYAYCGMPGIPEEFDTYAEARSYAAEQIREYRRDFAVTTLERGRQWEILEPEDCAMVPDECGVLCIKTRLFDCRECGSQHESKDDAYSCCSGEEE